LHHHKLQETSFAPYGWLKMFLQDYECDFKSSINNFEEILAQFSFFYTFDFSPY
jgi:hypothetical protein